MSAWLVAAVGFVYAYIALQQFLKGNISGAIIFSGYAFSNAGLCLAVK